MITLNLGEFASFQFSPDETKLLYIAEKKPPKTEPFYKRKQAKPDSNEEVARVKNF